MEQDIAERRDLFNILPDSPPRLLRHFANIPRNITQLYQQNTDRNEGSDEDIGNFDILDGSVNHWTANNNINNISNMSNDDNGDDNDTLCALLLITALRNQPPRYTPYTISAPAVHGTASTRKTIHDYIFNENYRAAWHLSQYETCHIFALTGTDPVNLLPLLAENHVWSDCSILLRNLFYGKGALILEYLLDQSSCKKGECCRHYPEIFELAVNCLPLIEKEDKEINENNNEVEEDTVRNKNSNLILQIIQLMKEEGLPLEWPYLLSLSPHFPEITESLVIQNAGINCSNTMSLLPYRSYNPNLFDKACKLSKPTNINMLVTLSELSDVEVHVANICKNIGWYSITTNIHGLIHLLRLQLDYVTAIRTLTDNLNGWQHIAVIVVLFYHGVTTYNHFIFELALALNKTDACNIPRVLHEHLMAMLSYTDLPDNASGILGLKNITGWLATSSSSAATVDLSCRMDLESTLLNSPFIHIDINNYLMCRVTTQLVYASHTQTIHPTSYQHIYNLALLRNCTTHRKLEYIVDAVKVIKNITVPIESGILIKLLLMAVRYMNAEQYQHVTELINSEIAHNVISELCGEILEDMNNNVQINRIVKFTQSQIERFPELEVSSMCCINLLKYYRLLSVPIIVSLVLKPHKSLIAKNTIPWIQELASNNQDYRIIVNNEYSSNNALRWNGSNALYLARKNIDKFHEAWTIKNGEGLDYGGIRKEFFVAIGNDIAAHCDIIDGRYLLPKTECDSKLLYDIGCLIGRSCYIDGHALHLNLHPFLQVMLCWDWILCPSNDNVYPWLAVEQLLGRERLLELAPQMYYRVKDLSLSQRENVSVQEMIGEMMLRFAKWIPAVLIVRSAFSKYRGRTITPPQYLNMRVAGAGGLQIDQLTALLNVSGSPSMRDLLPIYAETLLNILEEWPLNDQIRMYRFWFGTERPRWDVDEPPRLVIVGPGGKAAISRTCFNQLEISRMDNDDYDLCQLHNHIESQLQASLLNQMMAEQAGLLYQMN